MDDLEGAGQAAGVGAPVPAAAATLVVAAQPEHPPTCDRCHEPLNMIGKCGDRYCRAGVERPPDTITPGLS